MVSLVNYAVLAIIGLLTVASAGLMHRFFGLVGVGLFLGMTLPIVALVLYLGRGRGGSTPSTAGGGRARQSKGAQRGRGGRRER